MMREETVLDKIPGIKKNETSAIDNSEESVRARIDALDSEQLEIAWDAEVHSWVELGFHPAVAIQADQFLLKSRIDILLGMLIEAGILNQQEYDEKVRRHMLTTMVVLRLEHKRNMLQAKLTEGINQQGTPAVIMPPGHKS
jgi:hypothetical protein